MDALFTWLARVRLFEDTAPARGLCPDVDEADTRLREEEPFPLSPRNPVNEATVACLEPLAEADERRDDRPS